ncbi:putative Tyrosine-protein phosphatase non-receptor type 2 [Blattamonas nauphoetae]|uniref:Tyrosine-protein phosphatase non-receptor type 2 n=1 Tax=Blattamonas nauphoetae TaxID=2049346 RepID=A0ABQ9Y3S8_9EUKA|nr:putative Tyrosine-protein phosphatase non-receptor type 2 [Blattamonas nauphoetae]
MANFDSHAEKLWDMFLSLANEQYTDTAEKASKFPEMNRYINIVPWDSCAVEIDTPRGNYINASLFDRDGFKLILAQAPLPESFESFWAMVYQHNVPIVVKLATETTHPMPPCHRYAPFPEDAQWYGDYLVVSARSTIPPQVKTMIQYLPNLHEVSVYRGQNDKSPHTVTIAHDPVWPDNGIPQNVALLLNYILLTLRLTEGLKFPPVIHCSAGVGRTGTFAAILLCLAPLLIYITSYRLVSPDGSLISPYSNRAKSAESHCFDLRAFEGDVQATKIISQLRPIFPDLIVELRHTRHPQMVQTPDQMGLAMNTVLGFIEYIGLGKQIPPWLKEMKPLLNKVCRPCTPNEFVTAFFPQITNSRDAIQQRVIPIPVLDTI